MAFERKSADACVAVILTTADGKLLLQQRDERPGIEFPGCWSLFAGRSKPHEFPSITVTREIREELKCRSGGQISLGNISYLGCERRSDRPWTEYVFHVPVFTDPSDIEVLEGRGFQAFTIPECCRLGGLAPHHAKYIREFAWRLSLTQTPSDYNMIGEVKDMPEIRDFIQLTKLGNVKDYSTLENSDGFVVASENSIIASINTHCDAQYIALLEFLPNVERGNHYHRRKVEYMTVLRGRLKCRLQLVDNPMEKTELVLESGQMLRMLPGVIQTYTAIDEKVIALEFSPQKFELADTIDVKAS